MKKKSFIINALNFLALPFKVVLALIGALLLIPAVLAAGAAATLLGLAVLFVLMSGVEFSDRIKNKFDEARERF